MSIDTHSYIVRKRHTMLIDIAPVCRDDLVLISPFVSSKCGGISNLCLVGKISSVIHLIDPNNMKC